MQYPETSEHHLPSLENLELYDAECHVFAIVTVIAHLQRGLWGTSPLKVSYFIA